MLEEFNRSTDSNRLYKRELLSKVNTFRKTEDISIQCQIADNTIDELRWLEVAKYIGLGF